MTNETSTATRTRTVGLLFLQDLIYERTLHRVLIFFLCNRNRTAETKDVCIMWTRNDDRYRSETNTMVFVTDTSTVPWNKQQQLAMKRFDWKTFYPFITTQGYSSERTIDSLATNSTASIYRASLSDDLDKAISLSEIDKGKSLSKMERDRHRLLWCKFGENVPTTLVAYEKEHNDFMVPMKGYKEDTQLG